MKQSLLFVSLLMTVLLSSCSRKLTQEATTLPPIIKAHHQSQKYNMQLDFMKHHLSGMLIVRQMPDNETRILASTYFGLSLFDFSLSNGEFKINSCIEPMRKKNILKLLEADFKNLFLQGKSARIKKKSSTFEERTSGKGFGRSIYCLTQFTNGEANQIKIKHPLIRLKIQLDKLNESNF